MQLIKECVWLPTEVSEQAEWIDDPYILPKKSKNQTCNMFLADMTPHIFISQILRWKTQFPEAFSDRDSRLSLCTYYSGTYKRNLLIQCLTQYGYTNQYLNLIRPIL